MVTLFDQNQRKVAVLQNAFDITETERLNALSALTFSLPGDDPKNQLCQMFWYARWEDGALYRIVSSEWQQGDTSVRRYQCEHAVATLLDDVIFGAASLSGLTTAQCIGEILKRQSVVRWKLGECAFSFRYEYGFENETLLAALFSLPKLFTSPYRWEFDTTKTPWLIHLRKIDVDAPWQCCLREGKNRISASGGQDATQIATRLYCLGYGEGVNQLSIKQANNGLAYLESPREVVSKYGVISRIFVDRSFEDAKSLCERGRMLLTGYQKPQTSMQVSAADLYPLTGLEFDRFTAGKVISIQPENDISYITEVTRRHDVAGDVTLTIADSPREITDMISELAERQRIEQVYSQGATQLYAQSVQANATQTIGAVMNFYIPEEMRIVNAVKAKISLEPFRSYSRVTKAGGGGSESSTVEGADTYQLETKAREKESDEGDGEIVTVSLKNISTLNNNYNYSLIPTKNNILDNHGDEDKHFHNIETIVMKHSHIIDHTHDIDVTKHTHKFKIPQHKHTFELRGHKHKVDFPSHSHEIEQGIFRFGSPSSAKIFINGIEKTTMGQQKDVDLTALLLGKDGKIPRGSWLKVEVRPNDLAYVSIDLFVQGFVQSRGGSHY